MPSPLEEWYFRIPICTRVYMTGIFALTLAVQLEFVNPLQLFYSYNLAISKGQYWRLITSFLYLGNFSLDWFLNMYFIVQYCRDLEEGTYLNRPADFAWMMILVCSTILATASLVESFFLGHMLVSALTYMWSRFYSHMFISFMGLFTMPAAYFPWVMIAFSLVIENSWPVKELVAIAIGHVFWFLAEEWPRRAESGGSRPLSAPAVLCRLLHQTDARQEMVDEADIDGAPELVMRAEPAVNELPPEYTESDPLPTQNDNSVSISEQQEDATGPEIDSTIRQRQSHSLLETE
ncbi:hypothetical protein J3B02_005055 [Coemansia erecta]|nr:hypothetical protein J3B02_005055 [Coemansia erecta]